MHLLFAASLQMTTRETSFLTFPRLGSGSMSIMQPKHLLGEREEQFNFFWQKGDVSPNKNIPKSVMCASYIK